MKNNSRLHFLVEKTKNISKSPLDKDCFIGRREELDIRVDSNSLYRVLKIMGNLIKDLEAKSAQVSIIKKEYYKNIICVNLSELSLNSIFMRK